MGKFGEGSLRSGGPGGPVVKDQKQAVAIMLSEKKKAAEGKEEYKAKPHSRLRKVLADRG